MTTATVTQVAIQALTKTNLADTTVNTSYVYAQVIEQGTPTVSVTQEVIQSLTKTNTTDTVTNVSNIFAQVIYKEVQRMYFDQDDATNLYNEYGDLTESNLKFAILDNQDVSAITSILGLGNDGSIANGEGIFEVTGVTPGNYIVVVQGTDSKIGAFLTPVIG